ncbi:LacI family DNA-binding transcriptional regulator [Lentilactobacillus senioris]|nr:substrate-binding domain-containing protein [Lentilactobacillus senioris]
MLEAIRRAADGMIIASAVEDVNQIDHMLQQNGLPYLLIDRSRPEKGDEVDMQNEQGGKMVADYLHQMGHQKVAVVITSELTLNLEHRLAGFMERMTELQIPVPEELIFTTQLSKQGGVDISAAIWEAKPTVVFAINDEIAIGLNRGFNDMGLQVPEDISIMGYDNIDMAEYTIPALTTINQPAFEMGETAAQLIIERIKNRDKAPQHVTLPINLVERQSVRKIK